MKPLVAGLCLGLAAWAPAAPAVQEETLVRRIAWPVTLEPRIPGGCDDLTPEDVLVLEDGVRLPVEALERRRIPAVHAIVIDNSLSMSTRIDAAKEAALAYLDRLPPDEPAMLASFSDNLILRTPLTLDRDALTTAMAKIEPYADTALNDAVYYSVKQLATRPERKILVLLSDGCDTASMVDRTLEEVATLAAEIPGLTLFPIGIDLAASCDDSRTGSRMSGPRIPLQKLAHESGGRMFETSNAAELGSIFDRIFERLELEGYVSYKPLYHGEFKQDVPGRTRLRRVRVKAAQPKRCRIESAGPLRRAEPDPAAATRDGPLDGMIRYRDWWSESGEPEEAVGRLELRAAAMVGHGADVEREPGWLYSAPDYYLDGRYRSRNDNVVRRVTRDYRVEVPSFERLTATGADPGRMLLALLANDDRPLVPVPGAETRNGRAHRWLGEKWIHGQTLLELRGTFGRALFNYDGYREFAYRKAREAYRTEMDRVLESSNVVPSLSADRLASLRRTIAAQRPEPTEEQLQRFLAGWLGDVRAHDLVVALETDAVNALLDPAAPASESAALVDAIDRHWAKLGDWFPPPTQVRIVTPLVPQYDPERDIVGFWRLILPRVTGGGPPQDRIPDHPLALTLLRGMGPTGQRIEALRYAFEDAKERRRIIGSARRSGLVQGDDWTSVPMVSMSIVGGDDIPLHLTVLWSGPEESPTPLCVDLGDDEPRPTGDWVERYAGIAPRCDGGGGGGR
jgi:Ca-activated chloride channel family protein